ncbi:MAG: MBL fold metallo-hydrolase [Desulfonatronovibrio sp.]
MAIKRKSITRRRFISGMGASLAIPIVGSCIGCGGGSSSSDSSYRTRLVILGSSGGVSWWQSSERASTSTALVVEDTIYLIDIGQGTSGRLAEAFNHDAQNPDGSYGGHGSSTFLSNLKALFFTHLHQDHTADYPSLLLIGPGSGITPDNPLQVYGPCNRGQLEINRSAYTGNIVENHDYSSGITTPTPGTRQMTETIWEAYAQTINNMTLDAGYNDFTKTVKINEIGTPLTHQDSPTCPPMSPFVVYEDNLIRVTATLVDHHQVYPAFAFRFDTDDGSVVISGDTGRNTNGNLQLLADEVDFLVHEVIDSEWVDIRFGFPDPDENPTTYALKRHMLEAHTSIEDVGVVAEECRAKNLVLNHIVPGDAPLENLQRAGDNFSGRLIIGEDLMEIGVG